MYTLTKKGDAAWSFKQGILFQLGKIGLCGLNSLLQRALRILKENIHLSCCCATRRWRQMCLCVWCYQICRNFLKHSLVRSPMSLVYCPANTLCSWTVAQVCMYSKYIYSSVALNRGESLADTDSVYPEFCCVYSRGLAVFFSCLVSE